MRGGVEIPNDGITVRGGEEIPNDGITVRGGVEIPNDGITVRGGVEMIGYFLLSYMHLYPVISATTQKKF